jgi:transcriptional regulator with AAA-type ATPase domain
VDDRSRTLSFRVVGEGAGARGELPAMRLVVVEGPDAGASFASEAERFTIGSDPRADMILHDRTVSRFHAEIATEDDRIAIRDLGSRNGTFVNDVRIREAIVPVGARVRMGGSVLLLLDAGLGAPPPAQPTPDIPGLVAASPVMQDIARAVERLASSNVSVLVQGETGTGKELIARELHRRSPRVSGPFVTINCGAIPENLIESELFGHVRGAFTGAVQSRGGKFQAADGGTLFLDEIGELPLNLQVKLLRALQERVVIRVGDSRPEKVDIRVVAATNKVLEDEIKRGAFREDLYYRLNVVNLWLPPLRERGDDVVIIAKALLSKYADEMKSQVRGLTPGALAAIRKSPWPGNIRQLENRLKKALVLCDRALLTAEDLDLGAETQQPILPLEKAKEEFQRKYVLEVLERNNGNRTQTARELGVDPRTIFRYLEKEPHPIGSEGTPGGPRDTTR